MLRLDTGPASTVGVRSSGTPPPRSARLTSAGRGNPNEQNEQTNQPISLISLGTPSSAVVQGALVVSKLFRYNATSCDVHDAPAHSQALRLCHCQIRPAHIPTLLNPVHNFVGLCHFPSHGSSPRLISSLDHLPRSQRKRPYPLDFFPFKHRRLSRP